MSSHTPSRCFFVLMMVLCALPVMYGQTYRIVDTGVRTFYNNTTQVPAPVQGAMFYGQDATYSGNQPSYTNNGDGTVTDNVTGLMWQRDMGVKISCADAAIKADTLTLGGHSDWRIPSIKELYSLILFTGRAGGERAGVLFIDTSVFLQPLGNVAAGEREIDAQTWTSTQYIGLTFLRDSTVFGVNFIDGRIKGYPKYKPGSGNRTPSVMYFRMVRGNPAYGKNDYVDNGDGTVTDRATGLMWQRADDGVARDWEQTLTYAEGLSLAGYNDWRLPNAKELQSIVDYTRGPQSTQSAAIDPIFRTTGITDPDGRPGQFPYFWSGTTHLDGQNPGGAAVYVAFGEAQGKVNNVLMDVHGAGAQRSDPKSGNPANYPSYMGPQGDVRLVFNHARCVRTAGAPSSVGALPVAAAPTLAQNEPNPAGATTRIRFTLPSPDAVSLTLHDAVGRAVRTLTDTHLPAGAHTVVLDATSLRPGVYFYRLSTSTVTLSRTLIIE
ncbi:MAG: DUF1566 domain-containing protein [Ignavibacteriae bacterium]|nr:DUF1566 domain-containing protein [Ignavibacteriota bacterium]